MYALRSRSIHYLNKKITTQLYEVETVDRERILIKNGQSAGQKTRVTYGGGVHLKVFY